MIEDLTKQGGAAVAHLVHTQEVAGSNPAPATSFSAAPAGSVQNQDGTAIVLPDDAAMLLKICAAHDGVSLDVMLRNAISHYGEKIGIAGLADAKARLGENS